ncbi:MAG: ATP-dependent helicase HrpB [Verrucomicrobia bacterium]|nr:ATP-dependent helicase HrpB [Verrucomicrobiota bacterium]
MPTHLPIEEIREKLASALRAGRRRLVIEAPTGSGKSTQVPQMLLEGGFLGERGQAVILQPRRIAARMLAKRVAEERGVTLGKEVGYTIRLDDQTSAETRIRFVTEGVLVRQMISRPRLEGVQAVICDEFHERHLYGDLTLGRILDLQESARPDLILIVMSATLETEKLAERIGAEVLRSEGRMFPVEVEYLQQREDLSGSGCAEVAAREAERLIRAGKGDVLVFLPGGYEIGRARRDLEGRLGRSEAVVLPLHGEMSPKDQDAALQKYDRPKVVVATNVAETSLTLDGVKAVVDCGMARMAKYDPRRGLETLLVERISHAAAAQRAGRAGRTAPGICVRLETAMDWSKRPKVEEPEIRRLDLAEVALVLAAAGAGRLRDFRWVDRPEEGSVVRAERLLADLGATKGVGGDLTETGKKMAGWPVHPRLARMLIEAGALGCLRGAAGMAALLSGRPLLQRMAGRKGEGAEILWEAEEESDLFVWLRALRFAEREKFHPGPCGRMGIHGGSAREAAAVRDRLLSVSQAMGLTIEESPASGEKLRRCILAGFSDHLARRLDGGTLRCRLSGGRGGSIGRESVVRDRSLVVAAEIKEIGRTDGEVEVMLGLVSAVEEDWLREMFPADFSESRGLVFEESGRRVLQVEARKFRDLILEEKKRDVEAGPETALVLAQAVLDKKCVWPGWSAEADRLVERLEVVRGWSAGEEWPEWNQEAQRLVLQSQCQGCLTWRQANERSAVGAMQDWLGRSRIQRMGELAPDRVEIAGGKSLKIEYGKGREPRVSGKIQDFYGWEKTPRIGDGQVELTLEILGPNRRPLQVTKDLGSFWRETYPKLKAELARKYPKHEWR